MSLFRKVILVLSLAAVSVPAAAQPRGWDATRSEGVRLMSAGKNAEAIALFEKVVAANPQFPDGHDLLASAHQSAAEVMQGDAAKAAQRTRHLQAAAVELTRVIGMTRMNRVLNLLSLAQVYGAGALNNPRETERYARLTIAEMPDTRDAYALLAWALLETNRAAEAAQALRQGRDVTPAEYRTQLGIVMVDAAKANPGSSVATARVLLADAVAIGREAMKADPASGQEAMFTSVALEAQAQRVEQNAARKAAMLAEARQLWEKGRELNGQRAAAEDAAGTPSPAAAVPPPPPPPPPPDKWFADSDRAQALSRAGKHAEALAIYDKYIASHPSFQEARLAAAAMHQAMGEAITGTGPAVAGARQKQFDAAIAELRRSAVLSMDLSADKTMMPGEYLAILQLYAPDRLNRPADADALSRDVLVRFPADPATHSARVMVLLATGRGGEVPAALATARAAVPATPDAQHRLGVYLYDVIYRDKKLTGAAPRQALDAALAAFDASLKRKPEAFEVMIYKSLALRMQAERFETDPARVKALTAEADRLRAAALELQKRKAG